MVNNQGPTPKDYALLLDANFDTLNNRPPFDASLLLDKNLDWFLIEYINEMELLGLSNEQTLNALLTMIGGLSNNSYCRNLLTGSVVWLNVFSHVLGNTGSNKSYFANEIMHSLKTLNDKYPSIYSNRRFVNDSDDAEEQPKKKQKTEQWSFSASTITEAALSKNSNYTDVMIVNPDGDNALKLLSYYEQNSSNSAQGVSCFCNGFDGIEPGSSRVTGVESSRNDRHRSSKLSMYVVSTGKKLSIPNMKMVEEGANDGVYGRVWYTHTGTVRELPDVLLQKQVSLPNFTHIALCCHNFFQNRIIEFRYGLFRSDFNYQQRNNISDRMQHARRQQNVNLPEFYGISMDEHDIISQQPPVGDYQKDDSLEDFSPFNLATRYTNEIWNESFTLEKHISQMWRKISYHLPKAICTIKTLRLLFRIMGDKMLFYINSQEGNRSYQSKLIPDIFDQRLSQSLNEYFEQCTRTIEVEKNKTVILLTTDDVEAGYVWCRWKLETTSFLFSTSQIQLIVNSRTSKPPKPDLFVTKSMAQRRMDNAMAKILMTPTIFFTNGYLSTNTARGGSGLFMQKKLTDLKYDLVLENLLVNGFVLKCDVIQRTHLPKNNNLSSSYYKQQPSYFEQSELRMKELQYMGINFNEYKKNYENSTLPKNTYFNNDGIQLIKGEEWIQFYHTFLNDIMAKTMIESKVKSNEIIEYNGRFGLNNLNTKDVVYEREGIVIDEPNEGQVEEMIYVNTVNKDIIPGLSTLLAQPFSRIPLNAITNESQMETESFPNVNFHPVSHSTPININHDSSSSSVLLQPDHETSLPHLFDDNAVVILPPTTCNDCDSFQSLSTVTSFPIQVVSSNSINRVIDILNSSSIKIGSTSPNYIIGDVLKNIINVIVSQFDVVMDAPLAISATIKKRGRQPSSKSTLRQPITALEINMVIENDKHPIWKKLILNKHVLASMSDLSRSVTGSDEINAARLSCIEKLVDIGCFINGDEFLNGKLRAVLKNSLEDPRLISALNKYGIDIDEYKQSFNNHAPFAYKNGIVVPALLNIDTNKKQFTKVFVDTIQSDPFYSVYLRIDSKHVMESLPLKRQNTSSYATDLFRQKQQQKVATKEKKAEKLINKKTVASNNNKKGRRTH
ncbi:unnamed protein product [Rotaria socialis]|uniref:Uncharacterized protein n=1 Tax=Rotaria socialis TaxID=392032 RepID=A0A817T187_9BILA|nr:unnamed protein product [Rotaria socialis]